MIRVAAAIIRHDNRILICKRGPGGSCGHLWEFPGGKIDEGEDAEHCVVRECSEELGIDIAVRGIYAETVYRYPDREIAFTFFNADFTGGQLKMNVHEDIEWVCIHELAAYEFCPADVSIVKSLIDSVYADEYEKSAKK